MSEAPSERRTVRKRRAVLGAASELFLRDGYQRTSMDGVAALAAVSKQTIYKQFADKERLFSAVVLEGLESAGEPFQAEIDALTRTQSLRRDLRALARSYLATVMQPAVLQFRRMVIAEAGQLPEIAASYYESTPERTIGRLAASFEQLRERGLLRLDEPETAAAHFAFLVLGRSLDRALFIPAPGPGDGVGRDRLADAAADAFLRAYSV